MRGLARRLVVVPLCLGLAGFALQSSPARAVTQPPPGTTVTVTASGSFGWLEEPPLLYKYDESFSETVNATVTSDGLVGTVSGEQYRAASYPSNEFHPTACSSFTRFQYSRPLEGAVLSAVSDDTWELILSNAAVGEFTSLEDAPDCEYTSWPTPSPADQVTVLGGFFPLKDADPDPQRFAATATFDPSNPVSFSREYYTPWSITISVESSLLTPDADDPGPEPSADQCPMRPGVQKVECRATWVRLKKTKKGVKVTPNPSKAKVLVNFGPVKGKGKKRFRKCSGACFVTLPAGEWWFNAQIKDTPRWLKSRAGIRPVRIGK